jgi:hypothetical protein
MGTGPKSSRNLIRLDQAQDGAVMANGGTRVADHQGAGSPADRAAVRWHKEAARE